MPHRQCPPTGFDMPPENAFLPLGFADEQRNDDILNFVDDADGAAAADRSTPPLVLLIVDDDRDVHDSTRLALGGERIRGRRIEFLHAYSAEEARAVITGNSTIAIILLDVVMETQDAGLRLLDDIRADIERRDIRVVIRTGQPGYMPESQFADNTLVNGFLLKSRLTRALLIDAIAAALAPRDAADGGTVPS